MSARVVIAGPAGSGKKTLVRGLVTLNALTAPLTAEAEGLDEDADGSVGTVTPLRLTTKYYSAALELHILPASEFAEPTDAATSALEGAEALILVLDAAEADASLAAAAAWAELVSSAGGSLSTQLCVLNRADVITGGWIPGSDADGAAAVTYGTLRAPSGGAPEELAAGAPAAPAAPPASYRALVQRVSDWALDSGFELVECAAHASLVSARARDKAGVARVLEALQSTMWSCMEKPAAPAGKASGKGSEAGAAAGGGGGSAAAGEARSGGGAPAALPISPSLLEALPLSSVTGAVPGFASGEFEVDGAGGRREAADAMAAEAAGSAAAAAGGGGEAEAEAPAAAEAAPRTAVAEHATAELRAAVASAGAGGSGLAAGDGASGEAEILPLLPSAAAAAEADAEGEVADSAAAAMSAADAAAAAAFDAETDELSRLMAAMQTVRDAARGGSMSDEARREAAASMAMRLLAMMGAEDDEEGESEGEED